MIVLSFGLCEGHRDLLPGQSPVCTGNNDAIFLVQPYLQATVTLQRLGRWVVAINPLTQEIWLIRADAGRLCDVPSQE
jgi:hypothetical protein